MAALLPRLRNDYFHGSFLLAPELLHLALEVREMADRFTMPRKPTLTLRDTPDEGGLL